MIKLLVCPLCGQKNEVGENICSRCGEDLSLYSQIYYAPDVLFNMAVRMMEQGEYGAAEELLLTAGRLKPADQDILNLLVELYVKKENFEKAIEKCLGILEINPEDEKANRLIEELAEKINVQAEKKQKAADFLRKTISELFTQTTGETPEPESLLKTSGNIEKPPEPNETEEEAVPQTENLPLQEFTKKISGVWQKTNRWFLISIAALALFMALGFGAVYLKLSENISVQTNMWAMSTEGKLAQIAESLEKQVKNLENEIDSLKKEQAGQVEEISEQQKELNQLAENIFRLSENTNQLAASFLEKQELSDQELKKILQTTQSLGKEIKLLKEQMDTMLKKFEELGTKDESLP